MFKTTQLYNCLTGLVVTTSSTECCNHEQFRPTVATNFIILATKYFKNFVCNFITVSGQRDPLLTSGHLRLIEP